MALERCQDQARCPLLERFEKTLALLDLSHVLCFALV